MKQESFVFRRERFKWIHPYIRGRGLASGFLFAVCQEFLFRVSTPISLPMQCAVASALKALPKEVQEEFFNSILSIARDEDCVDLTRLKGRRLEMYLGLSQVLDKEKKKLIFDWLMSVTDEDLERLIAECKDMTPEDFTEKDAKKMLNEMANFKTAKEFEQACQVKE